MKIILVLKNLLRKLKMSRMIKEYKELLNNDSFPNIHEFYTKTTSFFNKHSKDLGGVVFETNFYKSKFLYEWSVFLSIKCMY